METYKLKFGLSFILVLLVFIVSGQVRFTKQVNLPPQLEETSALVYYNGLFWTINDSGGKNELYAFNRKGEIKRTIVIQGAENHDWEALALNENYLFIGDFGNNFGRRKNLIIYGVSLKDLSGEAAPVTLSIRYKYTDQKFRFFRCKKTPFDCESMVVMNDSIYLFTKDWKRSNSAVHILPIKTGSFKTVKLKEMNANGLLTDASFTEKQVWFIGYQNYFPVLWTYNPDHWNKPVFRYHFKDYRRYQVEGIVHVNDTLFISAEKSATEQALFFIPVSEVTKK